MTYGHHPLLAALAIPASIVLSAHAQAPGRGSGTAAARESATRIVTQIQRADYEGDRAALQRLFEELAPFAETGDLASRVRYWRGFALWRKVLNGFNDSADPKELEQDATRAVSEFEHAFTRDPAFVDAKVAASGCLSNLIFLNRENPARMQELITRSGGLLKEARAAAPDNPRLLWVWGAIQWVVGPERGGGQAAAIATYQKGLASARQMKGPGRDPLEPSWGEPELLMNLAWSHLNLATPDVGAAEKYAREALALVPYWRYVRDILMPQIHDALNRPRR
jgi:hypothetical protein